MSKELQIRNSTVDFLVFTRDAGEDGIEVRNFFFIIQVPPLCFTSILSLCHSKVLLVLTEYHRKKRVSMPT